LHFNFDVSRGDEKSKRVHQKLVQIYFSEGQHTFIKALHNWFENRDEEALSSNLTSQINVLKINEVLHEQFSWNMENKKITHLQSL
jgi:catabolite regulation protein CreA